MLNKLKDAGLDEQGLATVFQAIVVSRVLYALPAWFGQLTQLDIGRINGLFRKAHRWQLTVTGHVYTVEQLAGTGCRAYFKGFFTGGEKRLKGQDMRVIGGIAFGRDSTRPNIKTAGPGIRIGVRSQYNRPTFCFICCRSTTI